jgi:hypothetical protein
VDDGVVGEAAGLRDELLDELHGLGCAGSYEDVLALGNTRDRFPRAGPLGGVALLPVHRSNVRPVLSTNTPF